MDSASGALQVTCILPVHNGARYLRDAIDSVLSQTHPLLETMVVDDGSTDGTADVIASYGDRVRVVRQTNAGVAAARNQGLALARGDLIAFQDADDVWYPERVARQVARFGMRPGLELCSAHLQNFWVPELAQEADRYSDDLRSKPFPGYGTPPTLLLRKALFDTVGLFNASLRVGSDVDWFVRAIERGVVMEILPDVLVRRRLHTGNISRGPRPELAQILRDSLDRRRGTRSQVATPVGSLTSPAADGKTG
jgi:glycosyltransferase involved in cell wall biosynthesis